MARRSGASSPWPTRAGRRSSSRGGGPGVRGAEAEAELVRALSVVNRLEGIDLCIIGRGGGAREDLAAFNRESVCRALARIRVPTISAVGHETDISLTDLVADV